MRCRVCSISSGSTLCSGLSDQINITKYNIWKGHAQTGKIMIKSSVITNWLSITMAGLIIDYLFSSDQPALKDISHYCPPKYQLCHHFNKYFYKSEVLSNLILYQFGQIKMLNYNPAIWADNSVKIWRNLPISNPKPDLHNINIHTKFGENPLMFTQVITRK